MVSVCTNAIDGGAALMTTVALRLVDLADEGVAAAARAAVAPARFVGRFANLWGVFDIVDLGGRLHRIDPAGLQPVTDAQRLDIVDDATLRVATGSGFGSPGEPVVFERAADGTVAAVRSASMTSYPLDRFGRALAAQRGIAPGTRLDGRGYGTAP